MNLAVWMCFLLAAIPQDNPKQEVMTDSIAEVSASADTDDKSKISEKDNFPMLDDLVITATRTERSLFDTPVFMDVVTSEDLYNRKLSRTMPEALEEISGVMVQKTGHGQGSPFMRGFTGFRNLFMIDGIRLNNSVFRDGPNQYWATVDTYGLDRLEVIKGPGSTLYGTDAIGGTVNALTASRNRDDLDDGSSWSRRLLYRYSSAERAHTLRGEVHGNVGENFAYSIGGTTKSFGEFRGGRTVGKNENTDYDEYDWDIKLQYFLDRDTELIFFHQGVDVDDAWRTHKTIYAEQWNDTDVSGSNEFARILDQRRELSYLRLKRDNVNSWMDHFNFTVSYHVQQEDRYRIRKTGSGRDRQGFTVGTLGAAIQAISESDAGRWTYGIDYYRDNVNSFKKKFDDDANFSGYSIQGPIADDSKYDLLGAYVQDELEVNDRLDLIFGARYTFAAANADTYEDPVTGQKASLSDRWSHVVGNIKMVYGLDEAETWNLFTGVSQSFRAPNLSDLTRLDSAGTTWQEVPSPNLDPERYLSYELGVKHHAENTSLQAAYFYTDIRDMIVRTTTGNLIPGTTTEEVTKKNSGKGYVHGIELGGQYRWHPQWSVFSNFTWMYGSVESYPSATAPKDEEPLSRVMPITTTLGLRWNCPNDRIWVEGVVTAADKADKLSTANKADTSRIPIGGTPGYEVIHLRSGFEIMKDLMLTAGIENVTNADYRIHGSGQNEPGRSIVMGVDWRF